MTEPRIILRAIDDQQFEMRCTAHDDEQVLGTWPLPAYEVPEAELQAAADAHNREHQGEATTR